MTRRSTTTATRSRTTAATRSARARHELDEVLIDQSKNRMKGTAGVVLSALLQAEKAAVKNIAKREKFLDGVEAQKDAVREAYDEGDEAAVAVVQKQLGVYNASLLKAKKSK